MFLCATFCASTHKQPLQCPHCRSKSQSCGPGSRPESTQGEELRQVPLILISRPKLDASYLIWCDMTLKPVLSSINMPSSIEGKQVICTGSFCLFLDLRTDMTTINNRVIDFRLSALAERRYNWRKQLVHLFIAKDTSRQNLLHIKQDVYPFRWRSLFSLCHWDHCSHSHRNTPRC